MVGKRGLYEIFLGFFAIVVLVFAIIFFLYINAQSSSVYASLKQASSSPREAGKVKDTLLSCHRLTHLDADLFDEPCAADNMWSGYRVVQYGLDGCPETIWDKSTGQHNSLIPYVVAVDQGNGLKCLARLEVLLP
ncbi:hypothetical protein GOV10_03490 [Candidatus Woesearchaeota archaeon]|nr:hypothetical protein [Candidatus Woesearchaeota archaeon]